MVGIEHVGTLAIKPVLLIDRRVLWWKLRGSWFLRNHPSEFGSDRSYGWREQIEDWQIEGGTHRSDDALFFA